MSNITAVNSVSSPSINAELRPRANPPEDATRQARTQDLSQPLGATLVGTESPSSRPVASDLKAQIQDTKNQEDKPQKDKASDRQSLASAVDELNERFKSLKHTGLQFDIDDKSDQLVVTVMDIEKDEVIRQIPSEEILKLAASLKERADKDAQQMEQAALTERGLVPKTSAQEGLLVSAKV